MSPDEEAIDLIVRMGVAALGGLAVGIEREWSVKRGAHTPHFAGTRTFLLLGLLGALGAGFCSAGLIAAGAALLLAAAALIVVAYAITSRKDNDVGGTTEVAALVVLGAGCLAGVGQLVLSSGLFALTAMVLAEKGAFHGLVERIRTQELLAGVRFAVLALVVFPLLPAGPFGPAPGFSPRDLWVFVLAFSGLSYVSFLLLRLFGANRGFGLAGFLGGLVSSTATTFNFAQESRKQPKLGTVLGAGVIGACTVLPIRVALLSGALNYQVAARVIPYLIPPFLVGLAATGIALRRHGPQDTELKILGNPLRFAIALQMAVLFQLVLYIMHWASATFGSQGTLVSAFLTGLTDADALIFSMLKLGVGEGVDLAARALAVGVLSNTLFKLCLALGIGRGAFRITAAAGLLMLSAASLAGLLLF